MVVCVCVLEVCAGRVPPLTNTVRQRLHDISSAERWTSRDHDLSKTSGPSNACTLSKFHKIECEAVNVQHSQTNKPFHQELQMSMFK